MALSLAQQVLLPPSVGADLMRQDASKNGAQLFELASAAGRCMHAGARLAGLAWLPPSSSSAAAARRRAAGHARLLETCHMRRCSSIWRHALVPASNVHGCRAHPVPRSSAYLLVNLMRALFRRAGLQRGGGNGGRAAPGRAQPVRRRRGLAARGRNCHRHLPKAAQGCAPAIIYRMRALQRCMPGNAGHHIESCLDVSGMLPRH